MDPKRIVEIDHPLVRHHLSRLRDVATASEEFRRQVRRLSVLLAYEATRSLALRPTTIQTPLASAEGRRIDERIGIVPILRAGLGMVDPVLELLPEAEVWHLGYYRDEETHQPVEYYKKFTRSAPPDYALVLDPMLATGGSAVAALQAVEEWGVKRVALLTLIAAPEGIRRVQESSPATTIYVCAVDHYLNDQAFIVPGLGDAGDRIFNAKAH